MERSLLRSYIRWALEEQSNPRVAQQLVDPNGEEDTDEEQENVQEFSVTSNVAGFTAPLGMSGADMHGYKPKRRRKKKV